VSEVSTSTPPRVGVPRPRTSTRARQLAVATSVTCLAALLGVTGKVGAQTTTTAVTTTSTALPGASLALVMEPVTGNTGISLTAPNAMRTSVVITNETKVPLTNQQMVVRFGVKPDQINSVTDSSGPVGLLDSTTGAWFHTVAAIQPGERVTYSVNWFKYCPGKWPMAVRVGDRQVSSTVQWSGTSSDSRCPADETTNPQPSSFYALSWPSSVSPTTPAPTGVVVIPSTAVTIASSTTTNPATTVAAVVTTTSPLPTTTAVRSPTTLVTSSTVQGLPGPTTPSATAPTTTKPVAPTTTRAGLGPNTALSTTTTTISARSNGPTTTLFCKTIGGNKYCGPKSSAYKDGQEKAQELKPGQKPGVKLVVKAKPKPKAKKKR
jgi:hypothetical protein